MLEIRNADTAILLGGADMILCKCLNFCFSYFRNVKLIIPIWFVSFSDPACLVPEDYPYQAQLESATSDSMVLTLFPATSPLECTGITLATPMYTVYYKSQGNATDDFEEVVSFKFEPLFLCHLHLPIQLLNVCVCVLKFVLEFWLTFLKSP